MISNGQLRIREIVREYLPQYQQKYARWENCDDIYKEARTRFSSDPIITTDAITSRRLGFYDFSRNYLFWQEHRSQLNITDCNYTGNIRLDQFVYHYPYEEPEPLRSFSGGVKWLTTLQGLLTLVGDESIPIINMSVRYFTRSGILTIGSGGNHRLLAYVLWGESNINSESTTIITEKTIDPEFNTALLTIDSMFTRPEEFNKFKHILFRQFQLKYFSDEESEAIKAFVSDTTPEEQNILKRYIHETSFRHNFYDNVYKIDIGWLSLRLQELREILGRSVASRWLLKMQRLFERKPMPTFFERWYDKTTR